MLTSAAVVRNAVFQGTSRCTKLRPCIVPSLESYSAVRRGVGNRSSEPNGDIHFSYCTSTKQDDSSTIVLSLPLKASVSKPKLVSTPRPRIEARVVYERPPDSSRDCCCCCCCCTRQRSRAERLQQSLRCLDYCTYIQKDIQTHPSGMNSNSSKSAKPTKFVLPADHVAIAQRRR